MLKAKNIIISIITMAAVLFSIVMIPNTALADTETQYKVTGTGEITRDDVELESPNDAIVVSSGVFMKIYNEMRESITISYEGIEDQGLHNSIPGGGNSVTFRSGDCFIEGETLYLHWNADYQTFTITRPAPSNNKPAAVPAPTKPEEPNAPIHIHDYKHCIIKYPTEETDGIEGYQCSCGATKDTTIISSDIVFYENLFKKIDNAPAGQTTVLELKRRNTFTKELLEKLAAKSNTNFVIRLTGNDNKKYEISIQAGALDGMEFTEKYYGYKAVAGFLEMQEVAR